MTILYESERLRFERVESWCEVVLRRAPCNEIDLGMLEDFEAVAAMMTGDLEAGAVIFRSELASGFSAGADLRALYEGIASRSEKGVTIESTRDEVGVFLDRIHAVFDAFDMAPITTIGALHGVTFGGGFELALTCDVRIADKSTRFGLPELRLGLVPGFGGLPRLERDCGNAVVRDLLFTGRSLGAQRAYELGVVSQLVPKGESLPAARALAKQSSRFDRATVRAAKAFAKPLPSAALALEKETFLALFASPVVESALKKFVESTDVRPYLP
jgi:enoyl-CoA hydratase